MSDGYSSISGQVVIVGGGVAGLEALLALRALIGDRVAVTLVSQDDSFVDRFLMVAEPFGLGSAERHPPAGKRRRVRRGVRPRDRYGGGCRRALGQLLRRAEPGVSWTVTSRDVNVGQDRCGIAPEDALALADRIQELDRLRPVGLQGHEGNLQHVRDPGERQRLCASSMQRLAAAVNDLRAAGHTLDVVTAGGTGTAEFCAQHDAVTEVQPGSFMFMDADYLDTTGVPYQSALAAIATVISQPTQDRAVIDAGLKTLSNDSGPTRLADTLAGHTITPETSTGRSHPPASRNVASSGYGDRMTLLPSHIDTTVNLHDVLPPTAVDRSRRPGQSPPAARCNRPLTEQTYRRLDRLFRFARRSEVVDAATPA